jgi:polyphosphate kinase
MGVMTAKKKVIKTLIKKVKETAKPVEAIKNRELSWLTFNERVLQEAVDPNVPLLEKLKFLSIFSSNLDEFFRVRVASLRRLIEYQRRNKLKGMTESQDLLNTIQQTVLEQQDIFNSTFDHIKEELLKQKVFILDETQLNHRQRDELRAYFKTQVLPSLFPIILDHLRDFPFLRDKSIYLAVKMSRKDGGLRQKYAIIEVPSEIVGRFYVLQKTDENTYIILLDDVIRNSLDEIFSSFDYDTFEAYTVKLTRDAELDIDADSVIAEPLIEKITKSLKQRQRGVPVRFIFDREIP